MGRDVRETTGAGLAGALWGLGLARWLAEGAYVTPLYTRPALVALLALAAGGLAAGLTWWAGAVQRQQRQGWIAFLPLALPVVYVLWPGAPPRAGLIALVGGPTLSCWLLLGLERQSRVRAAVLVPLLIGTMSLAIYLATLGRWVGQADSFEFQVVAPQLGLAHPTGYPLYILLGKLFTFLPLGSTAFRVNLSSAACAALAAALTGALCLRLTRSPSPTSPTLALLVGLALAFSGGVWSQAVVAEVYALNLALVASALLLALDLRDRRQVWPLALLAGLGLTHHLTFVLLLPALGLGLLLARPRLSRREWLVALACYGLGLLPWLYVPLRWPALHDGHWMGLGEFVDYVTGRQFGGALQWALWRDATRYAILGRLLADPFGWAGPALAGLGLPWLALRQRRAALILTAAALPYLAYGVIYNVPDLSVFLLPVHLILLLLAVAGVRAAVVWAAASVRRAGWTAHPTDPSSRRITEAATALFALLPLALLGSNWPTVDPQGREAAELWGRYVLGLPLRPDATILADSEKVAPLYYLQQAEGLRPDLDIVVLGSEALYQEALAQRLAADTPVYLARYLPHLEGLPLESAGPLVAVGTPADTTVAGGQVDAAGTGVRFGEAVRLLEATLRPDPLGRPLAHLELRWVAEQAVPEDYAVRLRLAAGDGSGTVWWETEGQRPVGGFYPTNAWQPGVPLTDYHEVVLVPWLPAGEYALEIGLTARFDTQLLPVDGAASTGWYTVAQVTQPAAVRAKALPGRLGGQLGSYWLIGYSLPAQVPAGGQAVLDLAWRGWHGDTPPAQVQLSWVDGEGQTLQSTTESVQAGRTMDGEWRTRHTLAVPAEPGLYSLRVEIPGAPAHCRWLAHAGTGCTIVAVTVLPPEQGLANFDGRFLLLEANTMPDTLRPGESVDVQLSWRSLAGVAEDYTLFVQLVGPEGTLHGQVDTWPVQGTYPTSTWDPGDEVDDRYSVVLRPDAPAGRYRVVVGWYLLSTMERLPLVDSQGQALGDHVVVGAFDVPVP